MNVKQTTPRVKNKVVTKSIIYGSYAQPFPTKNAQGHTHEWIVFVRGADGESIGNYVKKVVFKLHESFEVPTRTVDTDPFEVRESGWGEFEISIKIHFADPAERPVTLYHNLQLYAKEDTGLVGRQAVKAEKYDEIIFNEPTEGMLRALESVPPPPVNRPAELGDKLRAGWDYRTQGRRLGVCGMWSECGGLDHRDTPDCNTERYRGKTLAVWTPGHDQCGAMTRRPARYANPAHPLLPHPLAPRSSSRPPGPDAEHRELTRLHQTMQRVREEFSRTQAQLAAMLAEVKRVQGEVIEMESRAY
ncbi:YEATS domain-containing protein 4 [Gonapodya sp. JEL0774]|nr:YEATS domain-containing protein 4 [Gonapodya sp. JEL0774]